MSGSHIIVNGNAAKSKNSSATYYQRKYHKSVQDDHQKWKAVQKIIEQRISERLRFACDLWRFTNVLWL